jgi:hypothetical protein
MSTTYYSVVRKIFRSPESVSTLKRAMRDEMIAIEASVFSLMVQRNFASREYKG